MRDQVDADCGSVALIFTTGCGLLYQKGNSIMMYRLCSPRGGIDRFEFEDMIFPLIERKCASVQLQDF